MVVFLCAAELPQCVTAAPACMPPIEVAHAKVVRVGKSSVLTLADGRIAHLEGVVLPGGASDHAPEFLSERAASALEHLTVGRAATLAAATPKEDRYGRIRAQVIVHANGGDIWLQEEMLKRGLARVAVGPDRGECAGELYAVEDHARRDKTGLWSLPAYAIRTPFEAEDDIGTFQIVEGKVNSVSSRGGRIFLELAATEGGGFAATISTDDMKRFREIGVDPRAYTGARCACAA